MLIVGIHPDISESKDAAKQRRQAFDPKVPSGSDHGSLQAHVVAASVSEREARPAAVKHLTIGAQCSRRYEGKRKAAGPSLAIRSWDNIVIRVVDGLSGECG